MCDSKTKMLKGATVAASVMLSAGAAWANSLGPVELPDCAVGKIGVEGRCATLSDPIYVSMAYRGGLPVSLLKKPSFDPNAIEWRGGISRRTGLTLIAMATSAPAADPIRRIGFDVAKTLNDGLKVGTQLAVNIALDANPLRVHPAQPLDVGRRTSVSPLRPSDAIFPAAIIERAVLFGSFDGRIGTVDTWFVSVALPIGGGTDEPDWLADLVPTISAKQSVAPLLLASGQTGARSGQGGGNPFTGGSGGGTGGSGTGGGGTGGGGTGGGGTGGGGTGGGGTGGDGTGGGVYIPGGSGAGGGTGGGGPGGGGTGGGGSTLTPVPVPFAAGSLSLALAALGAIVSRRRRRV